MHVLVLRPLSSAAFPGAPDVAAADGAGAPAAR